MGTYLAQPLLHKKFTTQTEANLRFTTCEMQGWRREMEDATICNIDLKDGNSLFAIFDGHGGPEVSNLVKNIFLTTLLENAFYQQGKYKEAFEETFKKIDEYLRTDEGENELKLLSCLRKNKDGIIQAKKVRLGEHVGSAANVLLITPCVLVVANCGDSRSVLRRKNKTISLSYDHKPDDVVEHRRITSAGGVVTNGRICGNLSLSRGFGDFKYKTKDGDYDKNMVSCRPDIEFITRSPEDEFLLLGCDGIFESCPLSNEPIINEIIKIRKSRISSEKVLEKLYDKLVAKDLKQLCGYDNMSTILIEFL